MYGGIRGNDVPDATGIGGLSMYSGEFSAKLEYQTDLDSGNIPGGLEQAFKDNGFVLSQDAGVIVKTAGQRWLIRELLFSVGARFCSDLDNEKISEDLEQAFADNGVTLSQSIGVSMGEETEHYWLIADRGKRQAYAVWRSGDKLNIYDNGQTYVVRKDNDKLNVFRFFTYSTKDGLSNDSVTGILVSNNGNLWFRTYHGGINKYNGKSFEKFMKEDGLASNTIRSMLEDSEGKLWFGSQGAGVSQHDGKNFQILTMADGLLNNTVFIALADSRGNIWFRYGVPGLTRYTPCKDALPRVVITQVVADRTYPVDREVEVPPNTRVVFRYRGISLSQFGNILYDCRLEGQGESRADPTREREIEYENLKPGTYEFQVRAIDRDLNYSAPQSIEMTVLPPFYMDPRYIALVVFVLIVLCVSIIKLRSSRKITAKLREELRQNEEELWQNEERERERIREELRKAHEMQMNLMSEPTQKFAGFEIYGRCEPADEVGGDFFRFIESPQEEEKFAIALSDVSGKGMKAAWIALLADGMIHAFTRLGWSSAGQLLSELNNGLYERKTDDSTFVAFCFASIDVKENALQFSNTGQRLPIIRRGEDLINLVETSGLLLGIMPGQDYSEKDIRLREGDTILFYTDGIPEATNQEGDMYKTERLEDVLRKVDPGLSPAQIADKIFKDVYAFIGEEPQEDDMTIVVLKFNGKGGGDING